MNDHFPRVRRIVSISLPIMAGMMSQNLLNLADTAMVGRLGSAALAAVGLAGVATFLSMSSLLGLSPAVQAMAARRKGKGQQDVLAEPLNAGLLAAVVVGVPLTVVLYLLSPFIMRVLNSDPAVLTDGIPYLRYRALSVMAIGINFSFRGYWNGISRSTCYMATLSSMNVINIVLNYMFIFGKWGAPELGAPGAGLASALCTFFGSAMYFVLARRLATANGFLSRPIRRPVLARLVRLAMASGTQQLFYAGGVTALYWIIGLIGTPELAAANIVVNLLLVGVLPGMGMGLAAASLVGQAMGRGDVEDASRWAWDVVRLAAVGLTLLGLVVVAFPHALLRAFTPDPAVLAVGAAPMQLMGLGLGIEAVAIVLMNALMGAGDNTRVMLVSIGCQWGILLPLAYLVGPVLGHGITGVWIVQLGYRIIAAASFILLWRSGRWTRMKV